MRQSIQTVNYRFFLSLIIVSVTAGIAMSLLIQLYDLMGFVLIAGVCSLIALIILSLPAVSTMASKLSLRWWHAPWLVFIVSGLTFRMRDVEQIYDNPTDAAALFRIGLIVLTATIILAKRASNRELALSQNLFRGLLLPLTLYSLFAICSSAWSIFPLWTLYKTIEYFIGVALLALTVAQMRSIEQIKALF